ncbi:MAG: hypothetical protein NTY19_43585 [Planctomycetota bacterium]|nr:hypothetical protein [Planctomycetota bacterium]
MLDDVSERIMVPFRTMPFFHHVQIGIVEDHPARGIVLTGSQDSDGAHQVAQKAFELALNHDHLKTFNLVIVPTVEYSARVFFFPRRRDGIAVFGPNRWQVSAMELCGMIPAKCQDEFDSLNEAVVRQMFATTCPGDKEFADFTGLIETF